MKSHGRLLIAVSQALLIACIVGTADAHARAKKWTKLFNGHDLSGWRMAGKGNFTVEDGLLVTHGGMGLLWYENEKFRDFRLRVEWKASHRCNNSGIFVRFPEKSEDPWYAVNHGYEIQIGDCDRQGLKYQTGSVYSFAPAAKVASKPAGEWNIYEITVIGQHYTIELNGEKVTEFDGQRGEEGYVGLQNHDITSRVFFKSVRVRRLHRGA